MLDTIYERAGRRNRLLQTGIALGKITHVDAKQRFCTVKTFFGEPGVNDLHLEKVQWLSTDANPAGDESTNIPRVNSTGLVFFVEGCAFIWGYFKATDPEKGAVTGKEITNLNEGDKIISTVGGNRIVVKANGSIEIQSTESCRTIYFPKNGLLSDICEAYTFKGDGGTVSWRTINEANQTLFKQEHRMDLGRTNIIYEERGYCGGTTLRRMLMGPGLPAVEGVQIPVYKLETDITGKTTCEIGLAGTGLSITADPLGAFNLKNVLGSVDLSETGGWEFKTPACTFTLTPTGDMTLQNKVGKIAMTATGDVEVSNPIAKITAAAAGDLKAENAVASVEVTAAGDTTIKNAVGTFSMTAAGMFKLKGATGELLDLIDQTLDAFINQANLTMTGVGPSGPLNPPAMVNLVKIKALLAGIKG